MKTLLHIISTVDLFGPQKTVLNECVALAALGWRTEVINMCGRREVPVAKAYRDAGVAYSEIVSSGPLDFSAVRQLRARAQQQPSTLLHSHGYKPDLYTLLAARGTQAGTVTTVHGWTSESRKVRFYESIAARTWRGYDAVITVSDSYRDIALRFGVKPARCTVMHNAILTDYASDPADPAARTAARTALGLRDGEFAFGIVGRLSPEKRHLMAIDIMQRTLPQVPQARLCIIGDGPQRAAIEAHAAACGMTDQVHMLGHRSDVAKLYPGLDALLITSEREGVPNVMLEAMLWAKPVVATAVGGIPEIIADPSQGLLAGRDDMDTLAAQALRIAQDPALRAGIGAAARARILDSFSFEQRVARSAELYDRLLATR